MKVSRGRPAGFLLAFVTLATLGVLLRVDHGTPTSGSAPPAAIPQPATAAATSARAGARAGAAPTGPAEPERTPDPKATCPIGAEPGLVLSGATFSPRLVSGRSFAEGTYDIRLTGQVTNGSNHAIEVRSIALDVGGRPWRAKLELPASVGPASSAPISAAGRFTSDRAQQAEIRGHLDWVWTDRDLAGCGSRGLTRAD